MVFKSSQIVPFYYIECQEACNKAKLPGGHDSRNCTECYRCVEINEGGIFAGAHYTPHDAQRWYIEYLHGQIDESFLIVSKLNGKALNCERGGDGLQVKAIQRNDDDDNSQHLKRKGSYIVSTKFNKIFFKQSETHELVLLDIAVINAHSTDTHERTMFAIKNVSL